MISGELSAEKQQLYYRLVALWAVCEGVLGGILHGFNLPITGLIVGGAAVIIISLIAYYIPVKGAILQATILVEIFKMLLSPQSPLPAYFAVFFQGVTGELFFLNRKYYRIACVFFAVLAMVESSIQRIITTTLIYGTAFWKAVNDFINGLTHQQTVTNYSWYIAIGYVVIHFIAGIFIGRLSGSIPKKIHVWQKEMPLLSSEKINQFVPVQRKRKIWKKALFVMWIALIALYVQSEYHIGRPLLSSDEILHILIRSICILLTWYFLVGPLLLFLLKKWLKKQQTKLQGTVNEILLLIPSTQNLLSAAWQSTAAKKGFARLSLFMKIVLAHSLRAEMLPEGNTSESKPELLMQV